MVWQPIVQPVELQAVIVTSDFHNCPPEHLELFARTAKIFNCNVHINAGDMPDRFLGHPAFDGLENYVLLTKLNQSLNPGDYKLEKNNWHLLTEAVGDVDQRLLGNNFLHFTYRLKTTVPGVEPGLRMFNFFVIHDPGQGNLLQTTLNCLLGEREDDCYFWQLVEAIQHKAQQVADFHRHMDIDEDEWVNAIIFGHYHHLLTFSLQGVKVINPGPWGDNKLCFSIIMPGPLNIHSMSYTENMVQVINPADLAGELSTLLCKNS